MANNFDSRALDFTDSYGQRFMREGTYRYDVVTAGCGGLSAEFPYSIEVASGDGEMTQHTVMLKSEKGALRPDPAELRVTTGDLVTWACREPSAPVFEVIGERDFFSSARLVNESGYAHAFGTAGEYTWVDAYGSGLHGTVVVVDPVCNSKEELTSWQARLAIGELVMITGAEADPAQVEILTGQTVYFAVTKGPGVSISDSRLIFPTRDDPTHHAEAGQSAD